jgi:RNA polymerase sigma-70 factor (ECF subfamily)
MERRLIERCKKGDLDAFDTLIPLHQDRIYNLALRLLGNEDDALDLAQEVFCTAFRKISSFRGDAAFSSWLYRITVNLAKNFWRKGSNRILAKGVSLDEPLSPHDKDGPSLQIPDHNPGPRQVAAGHELMNILSKNMQSLPLEFRQILILRFTEGLSYEEIAQTLECNAGTVKSRLFRARAELRKLMEPYL